MSRVQKRQASLGAGGVRRKEAGSVGSRPSFCCKICEADFALAEELGEPDCRYMVRGVVCTLGDVLG